MKHFNCLTRHTIVLSNVNIVDTIICKWYSKRGIENKNINSIFPSLGEIKNNGKMGRHVYLIVGILFLFLLTTSKNVSGQNVTLSKSIYVPGEDIIIHYSGFQGHPKDWISIASKGMADDKYLIWQYTPGSNSGSVKFNGMQHGDYEVRGFFDNGWIVKARAFFTIGNVDTNLSAKTEKNNYLPSEKITVFFSGLPGNPKDWISLSIPESPEDNYLVWQYTNGQQKGTMEFNPLPIGKYEVRSYFNNEGKIRSRYSFSVSKLPSNKPSQICRSQLSVFFAGVTGLGAAWARTTCEPTNMSPIGVSDIQAVLGNARDGLNIMKDCIPFDITELNLLINKIPTLTNTRAEIEIQTIIKKLQGIVANSKVTCSNGFSLSALYVSAVHLGAAQAHSNCQICRATPMPMDLQTVIRNHLNTARDAFAPYLPCVPGVSLTQFDSVPLNSMNSLVAHTHIVGLHTNLLWNISLSDCCCDCR